MINLRYCIFFILFFALKIFALESEKVLSTAAELKAYLTANKDRTKGILFTITPQLAVTLKFRQHQQNRFRCFQENISMSFTLQKKSDESLTYLIQKNPCNKFITYLDQFIKVITVSSNDDASSSSHDDLDASKANECVDENDKSCTEEDNIPKENHLGKRNKEPSFYFYKINENGYERAGCPLSYTLSAPNFSCVAGEYIIIYDANKQKIFLKKDATKDKIVCLPNLIFLDMKYHDNNLVILFKSKNSKVQKIIFQQNCTAISQPDEEKFFLYFVNIETKEITKFFELNFSAIKILDVHNDTYLLAGHAD